MVAKGKRGKEDKGEGEDFGVIVKEGREGQASKVRERERERERETERKRERTRMRDEGRCNREK